MTALIGAYTLPNVVAFVHRFNRRTLLRSVLALSVLSGVVALVFKEREVFDEMHQKRLFILHMENVRIFYLSNLISADPLIFRHILDHGERKSSADRKRGRCAWL
jgi:hypothetical protein